MNFDKVIGWSSKIYSFLEKFNFENSFEIDNLIDKNFPEVLSRLQTYSKTAKIAICSTNGKKTTTNMFNQILEKNNNTFITNINYMAKKYPVFASIILDLGKNPDFNLETDKKDYYSMALDEFEIAPYFNTMKFDYLLLNNLFVDQKNPTSLEEKRKKIQEALILNSKVNLIVNADEPMFYQIDEIKNDISLNKKRNKFYFGFESIEFLGSDDEIIQKNDLLRCPNCSCKLEYKKRFYSHIGQYDCACGFNRPSLDISAKAAIFPNYTFLDVFYEDNKFSFKLPFSGVYNAYNALGAIALALKLGIDRKTITSAFDSYKPIKARDEIVKYKNKQVKVKVIKNPTSLSEAVKELYAQKNAKVVFALNDNFQKDGMDTSWIWDSNLKSLQGFENKIYVCDNRMDDMALRLKYANVNPCLIVMDADIKTSIECCYYDLEENDSMLILATPSSVDSIYKILSK